MRMRGTTASRILAALLVCAVSACSTPARSRARPGARQMVCTTGSGSSTHEVLIGVSALVTLLGIGLIVSSSDETSETNLSALYGTVLTGAGALGLTVAVIFALTDPSTSDDSCSEAPARDEVMALRCSAAFQTIARGEFLDLPALPDACVLDDAREAFPSLAPPADKGLHQLGRLDRVYAVRDTAGGGAGDAVRLWLDKDGVVAVHITEPMMSRPWPELRGQLGEPGGQLAFRGGDRSFSQWVYPDRGLAVITENDDITGVALFAPTTIGAYRDSLALGF